MPFFQENCAISNLKNGEKISVEEEINRAHQQLEEVISFVLYMGPFIKYFTQFLLFI